jgi:L-alanine-DL-glutamate epimerase-like enolase superfamily enzyme
MQNVNAGGRGYSTGGCNLLELVPSMDIQIDCFNVHKRVPLTISRGTYDGSQNVWVRVRAEEIEGWGEGTTFSTGNQTQTLEDLRQSLSQIAPHLQSVSPLDRQQIEDLIHKFALPSAAQAALDLALQDWLGKRAGLPLWQIWGGDRQRIVPISVTIGISTPPAAQERVRLWQEILEPRALKLKLGNPDGIAADQAMVTAVLQVAPAAAKISVDANGGWTLAEALTMSHWLAERGVVYLEQPLPTGQEEDLILLYRQSPLPIFVDESCFTSRDIVRLGDRVHGINIKLMKAGGLSEALRMVHTAQACGLQIMLGCYSDSTLANTAAAHLSPFAHHLDLDSHLNLVDDPFQGATLQQGCLVPSSQPGLGVSRASHP